MSDKSVAVRLEKEIPELLQAMVAMSGQIQSSGIEPTLAHLIKLRASQMNGCAHCVQMHAREARSDGETSARLDHLVVWRHAADFDAREKAVLAWTEALTAFDERTDYGALRAALREHFGDREIAVLTSIVAMINFWNRIAISRH